MGSMNVWVFRLSRISLKECQFKLWFSYIVKGYKLIKPTPTSVPSIQVYQESLITFVIVQRYY